MLPDFPVEWALDSIVHLISPDLMDDMNARPHIEAKNGLGLFNLVHRLEGGCTLYHAILWRGTLVEGLLQFLENRHDILCVVIDRPVQQSKNLSWLLKKLGCPVIVPVSETR